MNANVNRAREIAQGIEAGTVWVDGELAEEMAALLKSLTVTVGQQHDMLTGVEFALNYYSEPELYVELAAPAEVILDGGLRARTALAQFKPVHQKRRPNGHTYGDLS